MVICDGFSGVKRVELQITGITATAQPGKSWPWAGQSPWPFAVGCFCHLHRGFEDGTVAISLKSLNPLNHHFYGKGITTLSSLWKPTWPWLENHFQEHL